MTKHRASLAVLCASFAASCGQSDDVPPITTSTGADAATVSVDASACAPTPCSCGTSSGLTVCTDGGAARCTCAPTLPPLPPIANTVGECAAGLYVGNFEGLAGFIISQAPVAGLDFAAGAVPLQIMLESSTGGSEFAIVGNGLMRGNANGTFPFEARVTGELDCDKKRYTATLAGSVQLFLDGLDNAFTGTMVANYDAAKQALVDGAWMVTGINVDGGVDFGLTGSGSWHAELSGASDAGVGDGGVIDAGSHDGGP